METGSNTATARRLSSIWARVLSIDTVDADATFAALGGNTCSADRAADEIRRAFNVPVRPRMLLEEEATLHEVASAIEDALDAGVLSN